MAHTSHIRFMLASDLDGSHVPRCAVQPPGQDEGEQGHSWDLANCDVLMQRKHEGDANDLSLRCVSTGPGVAMVASQNTYTYTHTKHKIT